jgi:flagellar protein FlbD
MIMLTKINRASIAVNSDMIEFIEETPDTVITMTNNDRIVVQESTAEIIKRVVRYRRMISSAVRLEAEGSQQGAAEAEVA